MLRARKAVTNSSEAGRAGLSQWSQLLEEVLDRENKVAVFREAREKGTSSLKVSGHWKTGTGGN